MIDYTEQFSQLQSVTQCLNTRDNLVKTGYIADLKTRIITSSPEEKKSLGMEINLHRSRIQSACDERIRAIQAIQEADSYTQFDPSFFSEMYKVGSGSLHPITHITHEITNIFKSIGFDIYQGSQVETQWNNFTAVNTPDYHPARDMQDTFFLYQKDPTHNENYVMRTQVTANAVRYAQNHTPPFRVIFPGVVFRNENIDATHDINFTQFDMWMIDKELSIGQLIGLIEHFFNLFFESTTIKVRLRPSYFPFTQPSMEGDISCPFCNGEGCRICKKTGWIEVFGAGPIHTNVIQNMNLNPDEWQGLAFGFGLDRLAQLKFQISGISQFYNGNITFLRGN